MQVTRNVMLDPRLVPGGGAAEMALAYVIICLLLNCKGLLLTITFIFQALAEKAKSVTGVTQAPYRAIAQALEVIPRTLAQNCGATVIRTLTALRAKHATGGITWGINGETGELADMKELKIWDPLSVKLQVLKTAVEVI